ncbi:unnamed protein product [Nippostrongylus brasiliensis]|uniref:C-SKI_SMAD_bind domain-containing protein n=1 Tax=Nippostrongylus brasiliensis TaxID=27835 RepID=A0A0N4YKJ9_NIPBR|nr:unnamed protein product [Nippostrongylus brasiliensis]
MATATRDAAALTADPLLYQLPEFPSAIPITPNPAMSPCESDGIPAWVTVSGAAFPAMVMGGEPRVPVHLLISRVLLTQGVSEIQAMMEDLNIHKSIATHEQAERLRKMDAEVSSCRDMLTLNLVTRSDAERLCGIVRIESMPSSNEETVIDESERLEVQHNVFGTVKGWVYPSRKGGRSVRCQECKCLFTPEDFVAHSHSEKKESQRTVHWGFDPANWRLMLELSNPLTESIVNKERWKEFIDDTVGQSCSNTDESCGFVVNKAKRLMSDHSMEVPSKVARGDRDIIEKPVAAKPVISESSDLFNMYLQDSLNRLLGPKQYDPLALLGDVMRKESAFKVKSLATMDRKSSSNGQLFPVEHQPYSTVPHPSSFQELDWKAKQLRSNCNKLETVEAALKNAPGVDPSILTTLQEIKASLIEVQSIQKDLFQKCCCFPGYTISLYSLLFNMHVRYFNNDQQQSFPLLCVVKVLWIGLAFQFGLTLFGLIQL